MRRIAFPFLIVFLVVLLGVTSSQGAAVSPGLQSLLKSKPASEEVAVIINFVDKADLSLIHEPSRHLKRVKVVSALKEKADLTQGRVRALLKNRGAKRVVPLWIKNAIAAAVSHDVIGELESLPEVESIEVDGLIQAPITRYETRALPEWNLKAINAPELWSLGYAGAGVVVANLDTGVDIHHPDLRDRWRGGQNSWFNPFSDPDNALYCSKPYRCTSCERSSNTPCDTDGHGTSTMGVMVGGGAGGTSIGVAPDAKWIAVKIYNDAGDTWNSIIHQGFQWMLNPDGNGATKDAPQVVNASWGFDSSEGCLLVFQPDIEALKAAGIAVVFAAGNDGPGSNTSDSPGNNPSAFAAGAVNRSLTIADFSSRGPSACGGGIFPDVVAPGVSVVTSDLTYGGVIPDSYVSVSGTSFSTPHTAGAMALLMGAFPGLGVSELEWALEESARDLGKVGPDNTYGYGLVDILAAYELILSTQVSISVSPSSYNFGTVGSGTSSPIKTFTVTNEGWKAVTLNDVSMTGPNAADFEIHDDTCSGQSIGSQGRCFVQVHFSPTSGGRKSGELSFTATDPQVDPVHVTLSGTAMSALTVMKTGTGTGRVAGGPAAIDCGTDCSSFLNVGRAVALRATPSPDSSFGGWSGCDKTQGSKCTLNMDGDEAVTATFIGPSLTLTSPIGGEEWKIGTQTRITWNYTGRPGSYVRIELLKGEEVYATIARSASIGSKGFRILKWRIPKNLPEGSDYKVRITSTRDSTSTDTSGNPFTIYR
jgi:subtilisin family serine protease